MQITVLYKFLSNIITRAMALLSLDISALLKLVGKLLLWRHPVSSRVATGKIFRNVFYFMHVWTIAIGTQVVGMVVGSLGSNKIGSKASCSPKTIPQSLPSHNLLVTLMVASINNTTINVTPAVLNICNYNICEPFQPLKHTNGVWARVLSRIHFIWSSFIEEVLHCYHDVQKHHNPACGCDMQGETTEAWSIVYRNNYQ